MIGDKHHGGHHGHNGILKWVNVISIIAIIGLQLYVYTSLGSYVDWWSAIASNSWLILNIIFHVLPHHQLVSFLKCRVCLVYVWFGIQAFFGVLALILVAAAVSTGSATTVDTTTYNSYIIVASLIVVLNFVQGISWVCLTSRLAREHHEELSHHGGYKSHH